MIIQEFIVLLTNSESSWSFWCEKDFLLFFKGGIFSIFTAHEEDDIVLVLCQLESQKPSVDSYLTIKRREHSAYQCDLLLGATSVCTRTIDGLATQTLSLLVLAHAAVAVSYNLLCWSAGA